MACRHYRGLSAFSRAEVQELRTHAGGETTRRWSFEMNSNRQDDPEDVGTEQAPPEICTVCRQSVPMRTSHDDDTPGLSNWGTSMRRSTEEG